MLQHTVEQPLLLQRRSHTLIPTRVPLSPQTRRSIQSYDNFDHLGLAAKLESHELLEFRRISALLYKKGLRWKKAVELAKKDRLFKDAMETVAQSGEAALAEELLK